MQEITITPQTKIHARFTKGMMVFAIFNYSLAIILIATAECMGFLLRSMLATFRDTPHSDIFEEKMIHGCQKYQ